MSFGDLVAKHYFHEVERRKELNSSLSLPLGVLTANFAAIAAMMGSVSHPPDGLEIAILGLGSSAAFTGLRCVYFITRAYLGYDYAHPASMGALNNWREEIIADGRSAEEADAVVAALLVKQYADCAERNALNNDQKSGYIHNAGEWLVGCLVLVILAAVPYTINQICT